jgi:endo-1,4-beta-xylanase
MKAHIASEVGHYKGQCYAWDVVNEALSDSGGYRSTIFYSTIGEAYIPIAFAAAGAADSGAKLYYNDYNIEYAGTKLTNTVNIVKMIQAYGAPIHGVGLQGHFIVGSTPSLATLTAALNSYVALGVEVAYTEIDVRFSSLPSTASGLQQQATDYGNVVKACLAVSKCVGLTVWDFDDAYSWIPSTFSGQGDACLYWANLTTKPAYTTISSILAAAATGVVSSSSSVVSTSTKATTTTTATTMVTTTTTSSSATGTATCTAAHWAQCGGINYTGCNVCAAGYTCTYSNDWYSQCL